MDIIMRTNICKSIKNKIKKAINNPYMLILWPIIRCPEIRKRIPDKLFIELQTLYRCGKWPDLKTPHTFMDKQQWLKLYDHKDIYTVMADKYLVKDYVKGIIGEQYIIPTIASWDNFSEIDFDALPDQFVLKCSHDSGGLMICKNKSEFDYSAAKKKINRALRRNYFYNGREWPYKNIKPRIIAEKYMTEGSGDNDSELTDYKFYCFEGEPRFLYVAKANFINNKKHDLLSIYDMDWKRAPFQRRDHEPFPYEPEKPRTFDKMVEFSRLIAKDIPFVRVDWYEINGELYFGETTFYPGAGYGEFYPEEYNYTIGSWITSV